jgi:hypothetical protein
MDVDSAVDLDQLRWRLAEAIAWCAPHVAGSDAAVGLRSHPLRHRILTASDERERYGWLDEPGGPGIVEALASQRAELLRREARYPGGSARTLAGGRLLRAAPQESGWDGAAQAASGGYLDIDDAPPWDSWLLVDTGQLVSWVPPEYAGAVDAAIRVSPVLNIGWAADLEARMAEAAGVVTRA